jgi:hypothetical protein
MTPLKATLTAIGLGTLVGIPTVVGIGISHAQQTWYNASTDCLPISADWKDPRDIPLFLNKWKEEHNHDGNNLFNVIDRTDFAMSRVGPIPGNGIEYRVLEFIDKGAHGLVLYVNNQQSCAIVQKTLGGIQAWKD